MLAIGLVELVRIDEVLDQLGAGRSNCQLFVHLDIKSRRVTP
jgi:hypothetical protein